jgi:hypothetical protein
MPVAFEHSPGCCPLRATVQNPGLVNPDEPRLPSIGRLALLRLKFIYEAMRLKEYFTGLPLALAGWSWSWWVAQPRQPVFLFSWRAAVAPVSAELLLWFCSWLIREHSCV